jgi:hypothetical protein
MNLPSLRREHAVGTEISSSPGSQHGWGSTNSSPSNIQNSPEEATMQDNKTTLDPSTSPPLISSESNNTTRAWVTPSATKIQAPTNDFPTAAEASTSKALFLFYYLNLFIYILFFFNREISFKCKLILTHNFFFF